MAIKRRPVGKAPKLKTVDITCVIPDYADPDQGFIEVELVAHNPELAEYDRIRADNHWPKAADGAIFWMTFLAWKVCQREGVVPKEVTFQKFVAECVQVRDTDNPDVDPTSPTTEDISAPSSPSSHEPIPEFGSNAPTTE
jgi:hypothetical protein